MGLLTIAMCSSVTWAQDVSLQESNAPTEREALDQHASEKPTFRLFQHGIWQPENQLKPVTGAPTNHEGTKTNLHPGSRKKTRPTLWVARRSNLAGIAVQSYGC